MIAYVPQRVFEVTGVLLGAWMVTFGVVSIARPAASAARSGRPIRMRAARAIGVASVVVGIFVAAGPFLLGPGPQCHSCTGAFWGGKVTAVHLAVWLVLPIAFASLAWAGRRLRRR